MAYVISPDGQTGTLDDAELPKALAQGFKVRQPTPEEAAREVAASQPFVAAGEAAVRTALPFGVGEQLLTGFEEGYTGQSESEVLQGQKLRKEENPIANVLGTGAGFVAGPAKVLNGVTAPMRASGLLGMAGAGAAEGLLLGVDEAINESMIENQPLTAEQLAATAIPSMLAGATIDFGFGVVSKGTSALLKKAGGTTLSEAFKSAGDDLSLSMIESKKWAKKYGTFEEDILKVAREEGVLTTGTQLDDAAVASAKAAEQRVWKQMADHLESAQYFDPPKQDEIYDAVLTKLKPYERDPLAKNAMTEVQGVLEQMKEQGSTWGEYWGLQSRWRQTADVGNTIRNDVLDDARKALRDTITENAGRRLQLAQSYGPVPVDTTLAKLNKRYAAIDAFEKGVSDAVAGYQSRGLGFKELVTGVTAGSAFGGGPAGAAVGLGSALVGKQVRKRGGFLVGETLSKMADSGTMQRLSKSFSQTMQKRFAAPEFMGPFRAALEAAAAQGDEALLQTHLQLAQSGQGPEYMATMGFEPATGDHSAVSQKLATLEALNAAAREREIEVASAVDGFFGSSPGRKGSVGAGVTAKEFEKLSKELQRNLMDPESAYEKIPPEILAVAPGLSGMTAAAAVNAMSYLDSKTPKDPGAHLPPALRQPWEPSAEALDKWSRYREAIEEPEKVIKNMARGYIAPEQVEALQAVYPAIYANLQQKITERLMTYEKPLNFQQRLALSAFMGPEALGMSPQQIQVIQQSQTLAQGDKARQSGAGPKPDGRQAVNEEQIQTESQKLEAR